VISVEKNFSEEYSSTNSPKKKIRPKKKNSPKEKNSPKKKNSPKEKNSPNPVTLSKSCFPAPKNGAK
jgi:hypothetical protein